MRIAFTRSNLPLSRFIRWGLRENVSHVVFIFDNKIVFHSNLTGCHIEWYNTYKKKVEIVDELEFNLPLEVEEEVYQSIIDKNDGKGYDYKAFLYFCYKAILHRFFGQPMPKTSNWGDKKRFICTGVASELPKEYFPRLQNIDLEILSPAALRELLKK
jgi:transcriptional regulator of met regulon